MLELIVPEPLVFARARGLAADREAKGGVDGRRESFHEVVHVGRDIDGPIAAELN